MHPADFVRTKIEEGKAQEIVSLIQQFQDEQWSLSDAGRREADRFAHLFLLSVKGQLRLLEPQQDFHEDGLLTVWAELGYFGIDRDRINADPGP